MAAITVNPIGGEASTLDGAIDWLVSNDPDLSEYDEVLIEGDWSSDVDNDTVALAGLTAGKDVPFLIHTDSPNRPKRNGWDTSRYNLSVTGDIGIYSRYMHYLTIDGLQIEVLEVDAGKGPIVITNIASGGSYYQISNIRMRIDANSGQNINAFSLSDGDADAWDIWNVILEPHPDNAGGIDAMYLAGAGGSPGDYNIYNCIWTGCRRGPRAVTAAKIRVYDSVSFNMDGATFYNPTSFDLITYQASDDNVVQGGGAVNVAESGGGALWPDDFTDVANGDFTLVAGSNLIGAGNGQLFTDHGVVIDIQGTERADDDLGATAFVADGGPIEEDVDITLTLDSTLQEIAQLVTSSATFINIDATLQETAQLVAERATSISIDTTLQEIAQLVAERATSIDIDTTLQEIAQLVAERSTSITLDTTLQEIAQSVVASSVSINIDTILQEIAQSLAASSITLIADVSCPDEPIGSTENPAQTPSDLLEVEATLQQIAQSIAASAIILNTDTTLQITASLIVNVNLSLNTAVTLLQSAPSVGANILTLDTTLQQIAQSLAASSNIITIATTLQETAQVVANVSLSLNTDAAIIQQAASSITFTIQTTGVDDTFTLPLPSGTHNFVVVWGDGEPNSIITAWDDADKTHTYAVEDTYQITLIGTSTRFDFNNGGDCLMLLSLDDCLGDMGFTIFNFYGCLNLTTADSSFSNLSSLITAGNMFRGCQELTEIPTGFFDNSIGITAFDYTFMDCRSVSFTTIPSGLFDYNTLATSFRSTFYQCIYLTTIPSDLFDNCVDVNDFQSTFSGCSSLTDIPSGLFDYNIALVYPMSVFRSCSSLTDIPTGLFDNNPLILQFASVFSYCTSLTSIPSGLFDNNNLVTSFSNTFNGCTSITAIPTGLFDNCPDVLSFQSVFNGCYDIASIPTNLFDNNTLVTDFGFAFYRCRSITSIPSGLFDYNTLVSSFYNTFYDCSDLVTIPSGLFDNNTLVTNFSRTFQDCSSINTDLPINLNLYNVNVTNYNQMFDGCSLMTGVGTDFIANVVGAPTTVDGFADCTALDDWAFIPTAWGGFFAGLIENVTMPLNLNLTLAEISNSQLIVQTSLEANAIFTNEYVAYISALISLNQDLSLDYLNNATALANHNLASISAFTLQGVDLSDIPTIINNIIKINVDQKSIQSTIAKKTITITPNVETINQEA